MTDARRSLRTWLIALAALVALNILGAHGLDAIGLAESVLSPSPARGMTMALLALVFFAARLLLFFVAPGLVLAALVRRLSSRSRSSGPGKDLIKAIE